MSRAGFTFEEMFCRTLRRLSELEVSISKIDIMRGTAYEDGSEYHQAFIKHAFEVNKLVLEAKLKVLEEASSSISEMMAYYNSDYFTEWNKED